MLTAPPPLWISRKAGPKVAFLPGMVLAPEFWRHYAPASAKRGMAAAYSLPAHYPWTTASSLRQLMGVSDVIEAYANALRRDFEIADGGPRGIVLVGHSTGAFIALLLALHHPELVERMVLVGGFGSGRFEGAGRLAMRILSWPYMGDLIFKTLLGRWISTPERFRAGSLTCVHERRDDYFQEPATRVQEEVRQALARSDIGEIAHLVRWLSGQSIMAELGRIETPALFIVGSKDGVVPPIHQLRTARRMRNAASVIMPGVGHLPMVEAPEAFDRAVAMFLQDAQAVSPVTALATALKRHFTLPLGEPFPRPGLAKLDRESAAQQPAGEPTPLARR